MGGVGDGEEGILQSQRKADRMEGRFRKVKLKIND